MPGKIAAIILAAGPSTRLGQPKQLVEVGGRALLARVVDCAARAGFDPVIAVLGADAGRVGLSIEDTAARIVHNVEWREGMASSIRAGLAALGDRSGVDGVLLLVSDQPRISAELLQRILETFDGTPEGIVACEYAGALGVPALFGSARFDELSRLRGDRGAKQVLLDHEARVRRVPWPEGALDVDRPGDYDS
jgi:molybdenum cofactor cytidylyltransferase